MFWLKAVPLKFNVFVQRLFFNRIPTKDNLFRRQISVKIDINFSADCGRVEDIDHLFINCDLFGRLWSLISSLLGISTSFHDNLQDHLMSFGGLGGFYKNSHLTLNII